MLNLSNIQRVVSGLINRSRYKEAERVLARLLQKIPQDSLFLYLAFKLAAASRSGRSRACLDTLLGLKQRDEFTLYRQFSALMITGDYKRAFDKAEELVSKWGRMGVAEMLNPTGDDPWLTLGPRGAKAWAAGTLRRFGKCTPALKKTPWYTFYKAVFTGFLNKKEALRIMKGLAGVDGRTYGWMFYYSGRLQLFFGRTAEAVRSFEAALKSKPDEWMVRCIKAEALACLKEYKGAHENFKIALSRSPQAAGPIKAWEGETLLWQGRYEEALKTIGPALAENLWFAYAWRAIAGYKLGNRKAALNDLEKALSFNPGDVEALVYRAEIARLEKDPGLAASLIKKALKIDPFSFWARANLALINFGQGQHKACLENFNKARLRIEAFAPQKPAAAVSADKAVKTLNKWFLLSKGNRRDEPHCLASWLPRNGV